ncbi:YSC84-related protein [Pseudooceanicola sp. HF7]|uniref:lipid-binding SYLF domain-containing protein n=1 Tax=Pseudooceanicola sp. HF7 TaxID=2721560 RepID=UPI0014320EB7|nr:YSC84-related protein [Pseudooceanicola sp. HF7]NIZ11638.1 twin-arginine translocation pathway signal [Pseudooceanicola sp. HF7]
MNNVTRRGFVLGSAASVALALAGCAQGIGSSAPAEIDARVDATLSQLYSEYPQTRELSSKAAGMLVMPLMTEAGLTIGGGYGRGALRVGGVTVDYYSATKANVGLQIGAQQYSHVLFFMTPSALAEFRRGDGWSAGADVAYAFASDGETLRADTTTARSPVIAVIFNQAGLRVGATVEGIKYSRILP